MNTEYFIMFLNYYWFYVFSINFRGIYFSLSVYILFIKWYVVRKSIWGEVEQDDIDEILYTMQW